MFKKTRDGPLRAVPRDFFNSMSQMRPSCRTRTRRRGMGPMMMRRRRHRTRGDRNDNRARGRRRRHHDGLNVHRRRHHYRGGDDRGGRGDDRRSDIHRRRTRRSRGMADDIRGEKTRQATELGRRSMRTRIGGVRGQSDRKGDERGIRGKDLLHSNLLFLVVGASIAYSEWIFNR